MAPVKEETVHLDPGLWIYHDMLSPKEKQDIIKTAGPFVSHFFRLFMNESKLYIPSSVTFEKRCSPKPFGQTKNGLVSGRLACTSSKTEILNKIGI